MSKENGKKKINRRDEFGSACAAAIPLIGFLIFGAIPLLLSLIVGFTELHSTNLAEMEFVGFENFKTILSNQDGGRTYASYLSTIIYTLNAPIGVGLGLYIAYLLNKVNVGKRFFRSVFFIPYVCSSIVIGLTFKILYNEENGVLNVILTALGFEKVGWLTDSPWSFLMSTILMTTWSGLGYCIVLSQAALANVDEVYYEAAKIDGASSRQIFWKITWPAISPTTAYLLTMKLIWALQSMAESHILVNDNSAVVPQWPGSEAWVSDFVVKHIYNMVFVNSYRFGYGLAAAAGWILAIIIFIITRINMKSQKRWVSYDF